MREREAGSGHASTLVLDRSGPEDGTRSIDAIRSLPQAGGPRRIGFIGNPRSHAYGALGPTDAAAAGLLASAEPATLDALRVALAGFAAGGVDLLVVQGGDGTLRDVLTALPTAFGDAPPELAILPTGNTNLAARVFGRVEPGPRGLARLVEAAQAGRLRRATCRTLRVDRADGRRPMRGLFLGAGLYAEGKRLTDARLHGNGVHNGLAVALAVTASVLGALVGRGGALRARTPRILVADGLALKQGEGALFLATTLERLMLGIWPFGRDEDGGTGVIRWLDLDAPVRGLPTLLLRVLTRRVGAIAPHGERRTGRSDTVRLSLDGPFVLDGEIFQPGPDGIVLSDGGAVTIVSA